jgi:hypothetical protein
MTNIKKSVRNGAEIYIEDGRGSSIVTHYNILTAF